MTHTPITPQTEFERQLLGLITKYMEYIRDHEGTDYLCFYPSQYNNIRFDYFERAVLTQCGGKFDTL